MANLNNSSSSLMPSLMAYDAALLQGPAPDNCRFLSDQGAAARDKPAPARNEGSKASEKSIVIKGQWTAEEDRLLVSLVKTNRARKWSKIAQMLDGRNRKQCRERWHNHLMADIKKDAWSEEEYRILIEAHSEIGTKWADLAKRLPGRTDNSIKNHWNASKRKLLTQGRHRNWNRRVPPTLLEEYIKSLGTNATATTPEVLQVEMNIQSNIAMDSVYSVEQLLEQVEHDNSTVGGGTGGNGWTGMEGWDGATGSHIALVTSWDSEETLF